VFLSSSSSRKLGTSVAASVVPGVDVPVELDLGLLILFLLKPLFLQFAVVSSDPEVATVVASSSSVSSSLASRCNDQSA